MYLGEVVFGGESYPGLHKSIIDRSTWQRVADTLAEQPKRNVGGRPTKGRHLLIKGMGRCGACGEALVPRTRTNKDGTLLETYHCNGLKLESLPHALHPAERPR